LNSLFLILAAKLPVRKDFSWDLSADFPALFFSYIFLVTFTSLKIDGTAVCLSLAVNMTKFDNFVIIIIMLSASVIFLVCPE
jgi:hypothetical protein